MEETRPRTLFVGHLYPAGQSLHDVAEPREYFPEGQLLATLLQKRMEILAYIVCSLIQRKTSLVLKLVENHTINIDEFGSLRKKS